MLLKTISAALLAASAASGAVIKRHSGPAEVETAGQSNCIAPTATTSLVFVTVTDYTTMAPTPTPSHVKTVHVTVIETITTTPAPIPSPPSVASLGPTSPGPVPIPTPPSIASLGPTAPILIPSTPSIASLSSTSPIPIPVPSYPLSLGPVSPTPVPEPSSTLSLGPTTAVPIPAQSSTLSLGPTSPVWYSGPDILPIRSPTSSSTSSKAFVAPGEPSFVPPISNLTSQTPKPSFCNATTPAPSQTPLPSGSFAWPSANATAPAVPPKFTLTSFASPIASTPGINATAPATSTKHTLTTHLSPTPSKPSTTLLGSPSPSKESTTTHISPTPSKPSTTAFITPITGNPLEGRTSLSYKLTAPGTPATPKPKHTKTEAMHSSTAVIVQPVQPTKQSSTAVVVVPINPTASSITVPLGENQSEYQPGIYRRDAAAEADAEQPHTYEGPHSLIYPADPETDTEHHHARVLRPHDIMLQREPEANADAEATAQAAYRNGFNPALYGDTHGTYHILRRAAAAAPEPETVVVPLAQTIEDPAPHSVFTPKASGASMSVKPTPTTPTRPTNTPKNSVKPSPTTTPKPSPKSTGSAAPGVKTSVVSEDPRCPYPYPGVHCGGSFTTVVTESKTTPSETRKDGAKSTGFCPYPGQIC